MRNSKKGGYIVEAAIVLPIFIVAVILLISIVPRAARCERLVYAICDEMTQENIQAHFFKSYMRCRSNLTDGALRALKSDDSFSVDRLGYCHTDRVRSGRTSMVIDDVITADFTAVITYMDPLSMGSDMEFSGKIKCRPYTGTERREEAMSREDMERDENSDPVYVFPNSGERYHRKDCSVLNPACEAAVLSQDIKRRYGSCSLCNSGEKSVGSTVFLFRQAGEAYHTGQCSTVDKYYIEMDRSEAGEKGDTACHICGG